MRCRHGEVTLRFYIGQDRGIVECVGCGASVIADLRPIARGECVRGPRARLVSGNRNDLAATLEGID